MGSRKIYRWGAAGLLAVSAAAVVVAMRADSPLTISARNPHRLQVGPPVPSSRPWAG